MKPKRTAYARALVMLCIGCLGILASTMLDMAHAQSVVGIWQCRNLSPTPFGMCQGEVVLKPDGTYTRLDQCGQLQAWDTGFYQTGDGYIHYILRDYEPKKYLRRPMHRPGSDTFYFQWVDPNTVRGSNVECYRIR